MPAAHVETQKAKDRYRSYEDDPGLKEEEEEKAKRLRASERGSLEQAVNEERNGAQRGGVPAVELLTSRGAKKRASCAGRG